mmetsp:Transcript_29405/g.49829  ORF Transcript_29405/g.49829 Transcript_29405/m.49829 type:complete len:110 (+) Transcript_29405:244-573(+)
MKSSQEREVGVAHPRPVYAMLSKDECTRSAWNCSRSCDSKSSSTASISTHSNSGNKRLREPTAQQTNHHPNKKNPQSHIKGDDSLIRGLHQITGSPPGVHNSVNDFCTR